MLCSENGVSLSYRRRRWGKTPKGVDNEDFEISWRTRRAIIGRRMHHSLYRRPAWPGRADRPAGALPSRRRFTNNTARLRVRCRVAITCQTPSTGMRSRRAPLPAKRWRPKVRICKACRRRLSNEPALALNRALKSDARTRDPADLAIAQVSYDCMMRHWERDVYGAILDCLPEELLRRDRAARGAQANDGGAGGERLLDLFRLRQV